MGKVVHFEITADDLARARKFYELFGWEISDAGMPGADYWLAHTGPDGEMGTSGAIMPRTYNSQPAILWIGVDDIDSMIERVKSGGGSIAGEKQTVPDVGITIYAKDTEGNTFGMIQPFPRG
ncbi:MAG TPA: VOC family protein [Candidatus Binatia bacterium]|nr:VOC family protein [Candidatus Binatia bacterium]